MLCVDSASDELLAGAVMKHGSENDPKSQNGITPNLKIIIRDATHAARRCSRKPEVAEPFFRSILKNLFLDNTITWRIQHSERWSRRFAELCRELEDGEVMGSRIRNLRAAAHRHESTAKPKTRFVLFFEAYYIIAKDMLTCAKGDRDIATKFFSFVTDEVLVQVGMLADGLAEGLRYVRLTDSEDMDVSEIHYALRDYLLRLEILFIRGECSRVAGFTSYMLEALESQRIVNIKGKLHGIGGPQFREARSEIIRVCLQRMVAFTKVAVSCGLAEFPDYDICCSFRCFSREVISGLVAGSITKAERLPEDIQTCFLALSSFFSVPMAEVMNQYVQMLQPVHLRVLRSTESMQSIWAGVASMRLLPGCALRVILSRFLLYTVSTAKVEQNWSKLKKVLGEQRLACSEDRESRLATLVLELPDDKSSASGREVTRENFKAYHENHSPHEAQVQLEGKC